MIISFRQRKQNLNQWNWTSTYNLFSSQSGTLTFPMMQVIFLQKIMHYKYCFQFLLGLTIERTNKETENKTYAKCCGETYCAMGNRWGFSLWVNPLINLLLGDGSLSIFAYSQFVQRMSITPHQISATESGIQRLSQKDSLLLPWHKCLACSTSRGITSRTTDSCVQTAFRVSRTNWRLSGVDWGSSLSVSIAVLSSGEE